MLSPSQFNLNNFVFSDANSLYLTLPNFKTLSYGEFSENPLFKATKEKQSVFRNLIELSRSQLLQREYAAFLENKELEEWYYPYQEDPKKLAYFALLAYFEEKITTEELFVMQMVADAYLEKLQGTSIESVFITLLYPQTARYYLQRSGFYPFKKENIKGLKPPEELEYKKKEFLKRLKKTSFVARTCIEYTLKNFELETVEQSIARSAVGFHTVCNQPTFILLSPILTMELYRKASSNESIRDPKYMFGYDESDSVFYQGLRVASISSPLFEVPYVHGHTCGPKGLGIQFHDLNYHLLVESFNPDVPRFIKVAKDLMIIAEILGDNHLWKEACIKCANKIIDRDAIYYLFDVQLNAFFTTLARDFFRESMHVFKNDKNEFRKWFKVILSKNVLPEGFTLEKVTSSMWWTYRV